MFTGDAKQKTKQQLDSPTRGILSKVKSKLESQDDLGEKDEQKNT